MAAASIVARAIFVSEWEKMEGVYGFRFPKGSSNVIDSGKLFVKNVGVSALNEVAKVSFITTQKILK